MKVLTTPLEETEPQGREHLSAYKIIMKPYRSVLAEISRIPGVIVYVEGISLAKDASTTLVHVEFPGKTSVFEEIMGKLRNNPGVIDYKILYKKKYSLTLAVQKSLCEFYKYTLQSNRFTFFPYVLKGGIREFYIVSKEKPKEITFNLSRHGDVILLERLPLNTAIRNTGQLSLKIAISDILTPQQRNILKKAYTLGYYDWPRKISLSELAEEFEISKATLSEHLRRGEQKLFRLFLESL
ncbi:helix-turn-helix domain-containing protein [Infirmifilum sp.]|uniref:helix-turn-helix domain-containing protein n=1 Tax=Infirmifilum sp. TaxID=2856575 RepID=UPI003D0A9A49